MIRINPKCRPPSLMMCTMADLAALAAAISSYKPGDLQAMAYTKDILLAVASASASDVTECEAFMACVVESFARAGESGTDLLDQILLQILPHLAPLAGLSESCSQSVISFCGLAAAACTPRDTITSFLEVMDQLLVADSSGPHMVQFLCNLLSLLPQQLAKLSRRKAAFTIECLVPAASLAKAHGELLQGWMLAQLKLAANHSDTEAVPAGAAPGAALASEPGQSASDVLRRMDTFLAANWQVYEEFVKDVVHKVLPQEQDTAAAACCKQAVGNLILHLLLHLTAAWPPPALQAMALQTLSTHAATSNQLPSAASLQPPMPIALAGSAATACIPAAFAHDSSDRRCSSGNIQDSDAVGVLQSMLKLLRGCQYASWECLASKTGDEAAGAALAALYSSCFCVGAGLDAGLLAMPSLPTFTLQLACSWSAALSDASQGNLLVISKIIALLQLAASHCTRARSTPATAAAADPTAAATAGEPRQQTSREKDMAAAQSLLPQLQPCINLLASSIASGVGVPLRAQASLALQQLLRAPGQAVSFCCLQLLLGCRGCDSSSCSSSQQVHPEVAALLMQEVRQQLASNKGSGPFSSTAAVHLVLPWLLQHTTVGWKDADQLADKANALCAALAVVRLALLRQQQQQQQQPATELPARSAAAAGSNATVMSSAPAAKSCSNRTDEVTEARQQGEARVLQELLLEPLQQLAAAVASALQALQAVNRAEQAGEQQRATLASSSNGGQQQQQAALANSGKQQQQQQQRVRIPGDAQGAGQAVDAWLAVSRVQDVLERVLELL